MDKKYISYLKSLDYNEVGLTISNVLRGKAPGIIGGTIAVAYVFYLAKSKGYTELLDPKTFIKEEIDDEEISMFLRDSIAFGWEEISSLFNLYDEDTLKAYIIFGNVLDGKFGIEYSTPESICKLAYQILQIKTNDLVGDFGTGQGTFIINAWYESPEAKYYGNEINTGYKAIAYIKAKLMGDNVKIVQEDMFSSDLKGNHFDKIFSHYPFGMRLKDLYGGLEYLKRVKGCFPDMTNATSSDWVYNLLLVGSLNKGGKAVGIMTSGSTWNSIDKPIREYFIRKGLIESVIALPEKIFDYTSISTVMVVFSFGNKSIRLIDARDMCLKGRRQNTIEPDDIDLIIDCLSKDTKRSKDFTFEDFIKNDFVINPIRYFKEDISIINGVPFETVIKSITRGAPYTANQLDEIVSKEPTLMQYLMLSNIKDGVIDEELPYLTRIDHKYEKYCLKDNCLLLSKNGYPFKVAVAHVEPNKKILANGNLYIIELDESKANPYYIKAFFESEQGIASLNSIAVGAKIPNIAVEQLKKLKIPMMDMEQQKEIANQYIATLDEIAVLKLKMAKAMGSLKSIFRVEEK